MMRPNSNKNDMNRNREKRQDDKRTTRERV